MSEVKNKIRDAVMALSKGDHDEARVLMKEVMSDKSKQIVNGMLDAEDDSVEEGMMTAGKKHMKAAHRHHKAGKKHKEGMVKAGKEPEHVEEMNDTGSDSSVMKGAMDDDADDVTDAKGSVKQAGKIDHKDYDGEKPNVYKKKDAVDGKPVNEEVEEDEDE